MAEKKTFKGVQVQLDFSLKVAELEIPKITDSDILIKVEAAAINPMDVYFAEGVLKNAVSLLPHVGGYEGSGTAVEVGKDHSSRIKVGDRICFSGKWGAWGQYIAVPGDKVFHLHPENSFEEGASHFVNPVTLALMLRQVQKEGHKAVIHSAGASSLGKMMIRYFKEHGIKTINLVRRDDVKEELIRLGADYVLNIKDSDFEQQIEEIAKKENATKFFDAIGGDFTVKVLRKMPPKSVVSVYGLLSKQTDITVSLWDLFAGRTLNWFSVHDNYYSLSFDERVELADYIQKRLKTTFKSDIAKTFPLERATEAIAHSQEFASSGKSLFKPWD